MKNVFRNHSEVAHVWASRTQPTGTCGNVSFEGETIYSWHWWPIATFRPELGKDVVVFRAERYSSSTSKHQSHVHGAISHLNVIVTDLNPTTCTRRELINEEKANIRLEIERIKRATKHFRYYFGYKAIEYLGTKRDRLWLSDARIAADAISCEKEEKAAANNAKKAKKVYDKFMSMCLEIRNNHERKLVGDAYFFAAQAFDKYKYASADTFWAKNKVATDNMAKWDDHKITRWMSGENENLPYNMPVYLRREENEVVTSKGARVPLPAAKILYKAIKLGQDVVGRQIGYYTVNAINGTLKIGCHDIAMDEVERFASHENWNFV